MTDPKKFSIRDMTPEELEKHFPEDETEYETTEEKEILKKKG